MHACLASDLVDLCLIPEVEFKMADVFKYIDAVLAKKGYMVILTAEGAGRELVTTQDADGNMCFGDIGIYLRDEVNRYLKPKGGRSFYIDPSYIIRSAPVKPNDHVYCSRLALCGVHTAM